MSKLSVFIRKYITKKYKICGKNNSIFIKENGVLKRLTRRIKRLDIIISGNNNKIIIEKPIKFLGKSLIMINGDNYNVEFSKTAYNLKDFELYLSAGGNGEVSIGENFYCGGLKIYSYGKNARLIIGKDCMFSSDIMIMMGDGHPIFANDKKINFAGGNITIGDHVWVGRRVSINKRAKIPSGSIVGFNSFVLNSFDEENIVLAGNPAKIIKRNIKWNRK